MMNITKARCEEQIRFYEYRIEIFKLRLKIMGEKYHKELKRKLASSERALERYQKKLEDF